MASLLFFALIFVAMYFLLIRPQRQRSREQQQMQRQIAVGDEVLLSSGIYGFVSAIDPDKDEIWIDIAEVGDKPVEMRVVRGAIARRVTPTDAPAPVVEDEVEDDDLEDEVEDVTEPEAEDTTPDADDEVPADSADDTK